MCESLSCVQLFATPTDFVAHQASLSMEFSRQEYWSGLPFPFPEELPNPGNKSRSPALQADSLPFELQGSLYSESESRSVLTDSLRPHRRQPTRLRRPWDSPGKNSGVGCHFHLRCMKVKSESEASQSCSLLATPWTATYQAPPSMGFSRQEYWSGVSLPSSHGHAFFALPSSYSPWNSPGQNTEVGSLSLLQRTFPTQESNQGLLHHTQAESLLTEL